MHASDAARTFDALKEELLRTFPGQYALVSGSRLMGVYRHVDEAMVAAGRLFDDGALAPGAPILISEIAARVSVRVFATPYKRAVAPASP